MTDPFAPGNPFAVSPNAAGAADAPDRVANPYAVPEAESGRARRPDAAGRRSRAGRWRAVVGWTLGLGLPLALALIMTAMLTIPTDQTPLGVDNPNPDGARALAQVLARNGVDVVDADSTAAAVALASGDTTLVIAGSSAVAEAQLELYGEADCGIVLIDPDAQLRQHLEEALPSERLAVFEDPDVFTNAGIVKSDNAATALRALGQHRRLVWNVARWEEEAASGGTWQLLPPWAPVVTVQLVIAAAGAALWRGRRMGRIVPDELPVTVPAAEVTVGLGGLYRRSRAQGHAAAALRAGTASRLGAALGLGPGATPATLVAEIARAAERSEHDVRDLLYGPAPSSAGRLTTLAGALDQLEKEVLQP
ncbi:MAG: DUF4350 domain-containing protein [Bifidobacteriaceae bacterium]|jgi:hypothetical protein|nr:DUF4350 domain-containing protein [Bifidobacteriaceae bacterium]